jgi:hypothetical protein
MDQRAIVEANGSVAFDEILIGWTDSSFRDLHVHSTPNATASTRRVTVSINLTSVHIRREVH